MRFESLKNNLPRIIPIFIAALLLLTLAVSGSAPSTKKATSDQKTFGTSVQGEQAVTQEGQSQSTTGDENKNDSNDQKSTSTKVDVSVNSNTTNGETTGQASVAVTQNGETQTISGALDACLADGNIRVKVDGTRINCESDGNSLDINLNSHSSQHTNSRNSSELSVTETTRSH